MVYFGYCKKCNYLNAETLKLDVEISIEQHQLKAHKKVSLKDIKIFYDSSITYNDWLTLKKNRYYWFSWKHRKKPEVTRKIAETLETMFPEKSFFSLKKYAETISPI